MVQVPLEATVAVCAVVVWVPSVAVTETVTPTVPVPLIEVLVTLELVIGLVTDVIERLGPTVFLVVVLVVVVVVVAPLLAVAL
jgi:hypothetical protein